MLFNDISAQFKPFSVQIIFMISMFAANLFTIKVEASLDLLKPLL